MCVCVCACVHVHVCVWGVRALYLQENPAPIPTMYSHELNDLVLSLLSKNPLDRPSAADVLSQPFIKARESRLAETGGTIGLRVLAPKRTPKEILQAR